MFVLYCCQLQMGEPIKRAKSHTTFTNKFISARVKIGKFKKCNFKQCGRMIWA